MVCPECGHVSDLTAQLLRAVRSKKALPCGNCGEADLRMRIMLYDDGEGMLHLLLLRRQHDCKILAVHAALGQRVKGTRTPYQERRCGADVTCWVAAT